MYIYDQGRTCIVSLGIGQLDAFGNSRKNKTEPDPAMARQLEEQMNTLAAKARQLEEKGTEGAAPMGFWNGVNSAYENWLKVRDANDNTKWPIHQIAAEAAMKRGDALSRYRRVWIALNLLKHAGGPVAELARLKTEKENLEGNWALVDLRLMRKLKGDLEYPHRGFSRGDSRAAFKWASEKLSERRRFNGLLPLELFIIDGQEISLADSCALSLASVVRVFQKRDGTFEIDCKPRPATVEINPLLID